MTLVCMMMVSCNPEGGDGRHKGHVYVDLGLSVKWATCNVGANSPEEFGNYYAWGETATKETYDHDNCPTYGLSISELQSQVYIDSEYNLTSQYDAATANWGGDWRMPTKTEQFELINNCTWSWTTQNGVEGYKVVSKRNGNYIFLPAAGWRDAYATEEQDVQSLDDAGREGNYWISRVEGGGAYILYFDSDEPNDVLFTSRCDGCSVRPVIK